MLAARKSAVRGSRDFAPAFPGKLPVLCGNKCICVGPQQALPVGRRPALAAALPPRAAKLPARRRVSVALAATSTSQRAAQEEEDYSETQEEEDAAQMVAAAQAAAEEEQAAAEKASAAMMPAETDAVSEAGKRQLQQLVSEEVSEEVEQVVEPLTFKSVVARSQAFLTTALPGKLLLGGVLAAFFGSLALATYRAWQNSNTAQARRLRQIDRNRELVEAINKFLLRGNRAGLTPGVMRKIQHAAGFSRVEVFRKYLWYLLRERKFDQGAVEDLVVLKRSLELTDADAGEALRERATRIYDKYGTLMLNTEGLTLSGAQRKATCTALFRKVLYLAECERLVGDAATEPGGSGAGSVADVGKIFGATLEDMERLRIRNLYEAELDLEGMIADTIDDDGPGAVAGDGAPDAGRR